MKAVLITTKHRGVFFGRVENGTDIRETKLEDIKDARMAIRWGTTNGVMQLAESGPTDQTKVGAAATISVLHDITAVFEVSSEAEAKWMSR